MIFYFSGTGNSQLAARKISKATGQDLVSINEHIKEDKVGYFTSQGPLVFVLPTYAWRIPRLVEEWIKKSSFQGNKNAYFILTCGGQVANAGSYASKLCKKKGLNYRGLAELIMPENYLALFSTPDKVQAQEIIDRAKEPLEGLIELILSNEDFPSIEVSFKDRILSGPVNILFYPLIVKDRSFSANDDCISCDLCYQVCPLNNILMKEGKPHWQGNCTHCMACIACCPTEAINYKKASEDRHRHYIVKN